MCGLCQRLERSPQRGVRPGADERGTARLHCENQIPAHRRTSEPRPLAIVPLGTRQEKCRRTPRPISPTTIR